MVRAYVEGVAAIHYQKDRAFKAIAKYARLQDPKKIDEIYQDSVVYLEKIPRVEPDAVYGQINLNNAIADVSRGSKRRLRPDHQPVCQAANGLSTPFTNIRYPERTFGQ